MDETKAPWRSLTVLSAATSGVMSLLGLCGIVADRVLVGDAVDAVAQAVAALLSLVAVYGRIRATTRIGR